MVGLALPSPFGISLISLQEQKPHPGSAFCVRPPVPKISEKNVYASISRARNNLVCVFLLLTKRQLAKPG